MDSRRGLAQKFTGEGVELGVARGAYSREILGNPRVTRLWSIDRWSDHHDAREYFAAARDLANAGAGRCIPLRMTFAEALPMFAPASLDFAYLDGYAAQGQEAGQTLFDWWTKVRPGGLFAGHDYHPKWPATMEAVRAFSDHHFIGFSIVGTDDEFPSWVIRRPLKTENCPLPTSFTWLDENPIRPGQSVILCGNGPSMTLRGERGAIIDAHDHIVRFNRYSIRGYEPWVGKRTTLWSNCGAGSAPADPGEVPDAALCIHGRRAQSFPVPVPVAYAVPMPFYRDVRERLLARSRIVDPERLRHLLPSSGIVVALWILEACECPRITLAGFDHFQKGESKRHHYWRTGDSPDPPSEHDAEAEAGWFRELADAGRVAYLP